MAENVREIVLDTLMELEKGGEYSHILLRNVLDKYDYLPRRDKAFIKRLTEGCVERRLTLDYVTDQFSCVPVAKMKPLIRSLVRMSVYQILYMDSVPDSAVCNEAVKIARQRNFKNLTGFVNGLLRNICANADHIKWPDACAEPLKYGSVMYSVPEWLIGMWNEQYGEERTDEMLRAQSRIYPVTVHFCADLKEDECSVYLDEMRRRGVEICPSEDIKGVYFLKNADEISSLPGYREGAFWVQDVSSAYALEAAGIRTGDFVMDVCAAPGGKSFLAAQKAGENSGHVLARDINSSRLEQVGENAVRLGIGNLTVECYDATKRDESYLEKADVVLMDVPCSGLGVLAKKRDIKYRVTPDSIESVSELQKKIVGASWAYVKPGGVLLYSTCTVNRRENEEMCDWICKNFPFDKEESRQLFPGEGDYDGFFYARLRRHKE